MNDTLPSVTDRWRRMFMRRTPEERVLMGLRMFDSAVALVKAGLEADGIRDPIELRVQIFLRLYRDDLPAVQLDRVVRRLRAMGNVEPARPT